MEAYLRPLVSCRVYTTIIKLRKKYFGENEKYSQKMFTLELSITHLCVCVCGLYLRIVIYDCQLPGRNCEATVVSLLLCGCYPS